MGCVQTLPKCILTGHLGTLHLSRSHCTFFSRKRDGALRKIYWWDQNQQGRLRLDENHKQRKPNGKQALYNHQKKTHKEREECAAESLSLLMQNVWCQISTPLEMEDGIYRVPISSHGCPFMSGGLLSGFPSRSLHTVLYSIVEAISLHGWLWLISHIILPMGFWNVLRL